MTKQNTGTLTLSGGANTYTGATIINNGTLSVGSLVNSGQPSDIGAAAADPRSNAPFGSFSVGATYGARGEAAPLLAAGDGDSQPRTMNASSAAERVRIGDRYHNSDSAGGGS